MDDLCSLHPGKSVEEQKAAEECPSSPQPQPVWHHQGGLGVERQAQRAILDSVSPCHSPKSAVWPWDLAARISECYSILKSVSHKVKLCGSGIGGVLV